MAATMLTAGEIAHALGGARNGRGWLARCCCHEDKQPSLSLKDGDDGRLLVKCFAGCDARDILAELRHRGWLDDRGLDQRPARKVMPVPKRTNPCANGRSDFAAVIWRESVDPRGTLGERYLNGRGLVELEDDLCGRVLRFHGHCPFGKENNKKLFVPALIVAFRPTRNDDETSPPPAIHRIGLNPDGRKIAKLMLGPVGGCAVKLDSDKNIEEGLGICEGIETGLAICATGWRPIWALGSAGAIKSFSPIPGIETITIFADHDQNGAGLAAARQCAQAWQAAGCEAIIRTPHSAGNDWLDVQP
jgi:putative DNA primase/helicase